MRKTKIVCTIGPASDSVEVLRKLCKAGMNVARINFSHANHLEHQMKIDHIKQVREELGMPIAILLDTKGPEYRIRSFVGGQVTLTAGDTFTFTTNQVEGDDTIVSVNYSGLARDLSIGDTILVNNGLLRFRVEELTDTDAVCTVIDGGNLTNNKSMSFPNKVLKQEYLSEQDKADLLFGIQNEVDFIACSFVSRKQDLLDIQAFLDANHSKPVGLIAKIENQAGIDNIEEICEACEGIMIGRGDLGVEIPYETLPAAQKLLISKCRKLGKRVITATEMLESMIYNPRPTRAEISDVANAVYDGTSAIMLSGETANGKYPVEAVTAMAKIAETTEQSINYEKRFRQNNCSTHSTVDAISHATCGMAIDIEAKAIAVCSLSGLTVGMVSRFRPPVDILGITTSKENWRKLALSWGVTPVLSESFSSPEVLFYQAKMLAEKTFQLSEGDLVVITGGLTNGQSGNTNLIKIETI